MSKRSKLRTSIVICLVVGIMTGCGEGTSKADRFFQDVKPNVTETGDINPNGYTYVIDNNTGVVYLRYAFGYQGGITVMLNADGTPVTAEQLGIKY